MIRVNLLACIRHFILDLPMCFGDSAIAQNRLQTGMPELLQCPVQSFENTHHICNLLKTDAQPRLKRLECSFGEQAAVSSRVVDEGLMDRIADAPRRRRSTVAAQPALEGPLAAAGVASNPLAASVIGPAFAGPAFAAAGAPVPGPAPRRTLQVTPALR